MQRSAKSFFKRLKRPALISLTLIAPFMIIDLHGADELDGRQYEVFGGGSVRYAWTLPRQP
jgi:hypothetical protein